MGKRRLKYLLLLGILAALSCTPVQAAGGCDIEQVSLQMPEITVYYRADKPEKSYEAYLDGNLLSGGETRLFKETGEGVDYYLMLDVSASIPDGQFENLKKGMEHFISTRGKNDRCILLTFGNESRIVLDGSESTEAAIQTIESLKNEDMETVLFQSIVQAAGMIEKASQSEEKRRVIVTITDGEDCVTGQATAMEAQQTLKDKGIPLYALAVDVGKPEFTNSFGEFSRNTGGALSLYSEGDSSIVFDQIRGRMEKSYVVSFESDTNIASNKREDFTIKFLDHKINATKEVIPTRWIPDDEAPSVLRVEKASDKEISVVFSEPVKGADSQANYKLEKDGESVAIGSVFYSQEGEPKATLTFADPLYTGEYEMFFTNITDQSMEKNALPASTGFDLEGAEPEKESFFEKNGWWVTLASVLGAVAILGIAGILIYKKIKKNKGVIYVDGKATLASNVDVKQHVAVSGAKNLPQKDIRLIISDKANGKCEMKIHINGSVMAGRSSDCDIYFDDSRMSRQHFALETDGEDVYITDLESRNGTFINGVQINQKRKLAPNDEIGVGNILARIMW